MPKYIPRSNLSYLQQQGGFVSSGGNVPSGGYIRSGGSLNDIAVIDNKISKEIMNFLIKYPDKAYRIANNINNGKESSNKKIVGKSRAAIAFNNYLLANRKEIPKLLQHADRVKIHTKNAIKGGAIDISKPINKVIDTINNTSNDAMKIINKPINNAINKLGNSIADHVIDRAENFINVDKMHPKAIMAAIQHATPHQYNVLRGVASEMIGRSHPMTDYIRRSVGGSFAPHYKPPHIYNDALADLLDSRSQHHLAEMMHSELQDMGHKNIDMGGGLWSSIKHITKKAIQHGKKFTQKGLSVAKDINQMLSKGLVIAQALEPFVEMYDPSMGDIYSKAVDNVKKVHDTSGKVVEGADIINEVMHGNISKQVGRIADLTLPENKAEAIKGAVNVISNAVNQSQNPMPINNNLLM